MGVKRIYCLFFILIALIAAQSAGAAEVTLSPSILLLDPGESASVTATSSANPDEIKWNIGDTGVAKAESGANNAVTVVTGFAPGRTNLTAQAGDGSVSRCVVTVSGVAFASESVTVEAGTTLDLTVLVYGKAINAPISSWEWISSDTSVVTVAPSLTGGVIRGIQPGTVDITLTVGDYQAACRVTVSGGNSAASITLSEATITIEPGTSARLRATTAADSADIQWQIGDADIAQIAAKNGYTVILTAGAAGQTIVTAQVGDGDPVSCIVIVSGFTLPSDSLSLTPNRSEYITVTAYGGAQNHVYGIQWNSSDANVARVTGDMYGATIQSAGAGRCTISCESGPYRAVCEVSVEDDHSRLDGSAVRENDGVSVTCWYPSITEGMGVRQILCALYDKAGALLALESLAPDRGMQTALIPCDAAQAERVKLFCLGYDKDPVGSARVLTLRDAAPSVTQEFTRTPENDPDSPYADSDIRIIFSENVQQASTNLRFLDLYQNLLLAQSSADRAAAKDTLAETLSATIKLYDRTNPHFPALVTERNAYNAATVTDWVIDYRNCTVTREGERIVVTFPTYIETDGRQISALRLNSDAAYYFRIEDISDTSSAQNRMQTTRLEPFRTLPPQVILTNLSLSPASYPVGIYDIDMSFTLTPLFTSQADPGIAWDMLIWSDISCQYEMYVRSRPWGLPDYDVSAETDANGWRRVQNPRYGYGGVASVTIPSTMKNQRVGQSLHFDLYNYGVGETPKLTELSDGSVYEYAIRFLEINDDNQRFDWNQEARFYISVVSGSSNELGNLASNITEERFHNAKREESVQELGAPSDLAFRVTKAFFQTEAPFFSMGQPAFTSGAGSVETLLQLSGQGGVFYAFAPADDTIKVRDLDGLAVNWTRKDEIPTTGSDVRRDAQGNEIRDEDGNSIHLAPFYVSVPSYLEIVDPEYDDNPEYDGKGIITGYVPIASDAVTFTTNGLLPKTNYFAYFVIRGVGQAYSPYAQIFRFTTL